LEETREESMEERQEYTRMYSVFFFGFWVCVMVVEEGGGGREPKRGNHCLKIYFLCHVSDWVLLPELRSKCKKTLGNIARKFTASATKKPHLVERTHTWVAIKK